MKCKLTNKKGKFVKSHIIPKSFFHLNKDPFDALVISGKDDKFPKQAPIGVYDTEILTKEGENYFKELDNYGFKTLIENRKLFNDYIVDSKVIGRKINKHKYDHKKLKIFFLSILWRASISSRMEYDKVLLGKKYEDDIKNIILNNNLFNDDYDIFIFRYVEKVFYNGTVLFPIRTKISGINYYKIFLSEYIIHIKVTNQPSPDYVEIFLMKENSDLLIFDIEFSKSKEKNMILKTLEKTKKLLPAWYQKKLKDEENKKTTHS